MYTDLKLLWNVREAGVALGISPWTIRSYVRQGRLRPVRVGRRVLLEPEECRRFLEACKASRKSGYIRSPRPRRVSLT
jgi:excisionase family DNA binding protein